MVKKIIFLSTFLLIFIIPNINVKAATMPTPSFVNARFNDGYIETSQPGYSNVEYFTSGQWYYKSNYLLGGVTSSEYVDRINFGWNNPALCSDNSELELKGSIAVIQDFFNREQYDVEFYSNGSKMSCNFNFDNTVSPTFSKLDFTCTGRSGGGLNLYVYSLSHYFNSTYMVGFKKDVTYSCDVSNGAIIENNNNNTQNIINNNTQNSQNIINNQNSNTNSIINNQDSNTQDIITNQNQNTQQEIQSQKVCQFIDINSISTQNSFLNTDGSVGTSSVSGITDFISITSSSNLSISTINNLGSANRLCFYNTNKSLISCLDTRNLTGSINIPSDSSFVRFTINSQSNKPQFTLCRNGNQALNDSVNNLNDSITSTDTPNTNQDIDDMNGMVASDTPISDLITMPLTLINAYINGIGSTCSPVNLGSLLGTNLAIPCINLEQRLGSNLWNTIDILCCIFLCYEIAMLFISAFDGITSLRDDFEGLYQPRHAYTGYVPKHGGGN